MQEGLRNDFENQFIQGKHLSEIGILIILAFCSEGKFFHFVVTKNITAPFRLLHMYICLSFQMSLPNHVS